MDGELNILIQVPRGAPAPSSTTLTNRFMKEPATKEVSMDSLELQIIPAAPVIENLPSNPRPAPADNEPTTLPTVSAKFFISVSTTAIDNMSSVRVRTTNHVTAQYQETFKVLCARNARYESRSIKPKPNRNIN